jgi:hypothetical protein
MHTNMNRYGVDGVARVRELEAEVERLTTKFKLLTTSTERELLAERERLWSENTHLKHLDYENAELQVRLNELVEAVGAAAVVHLVEDGPIRLIPGEWQHITESAIAARSALDENAVERWQQVARDFNADGAHWKAETERLREALQEIIAEGYDSDFAVETARNALGIS